jgi:hypothetical protein
MACLGSPMRRKGSGPSGGWKMAPKIASCRSVSWNSSISAAR